MLRFRLLICVLLIACAAPQTSESASKPKPDVHYAYSGQILLQPKDATHTFGTVIYKNVNYRPGQPVVQFMHGIGERGSGSAVDLRRMSSWPILQTLYQAADVFGFNVVIVQTANEYEKGEIPYGYKTAIGDLVGSSSDIHLLCHSLGGYGLLKEVSKSAAIVSPYATITISASGPGTATYTAKNLSTARAVWLLTSAVDTISGTSYKVTDNLFTAMQALGATVWETKYNTQTHNGVLSSIIWSFNKAPNVGFPVNSIIATGLNSVKTSWYQWILNNHLGSTVKSPKDDIVVAAPVPTIPPVYLHDTIKIQVPFPVHDTVFMPVHDTVYVVPPVSLRKTIRVFSDGSTEEVN